MFYSERHKEIMRLLDEKNSISVRYLSQHLFVSEPTIRRDLKALEAKNLIKRTFGGAVKNEMTLSEVPLSMRESEYNLAKDIIAIEAIKHIKNGNIIFLDASSTASKIIKYLPKFSDITVITNSPKNSMQLAELRIHSFSTGGLMLENSIAYVGNLAETFLKNFNADLCFFSCRGLSENGILTDSSVEESSIRKIMFQNAKKKIFLCTSNKIGKEYMFNLCMLSSLDVIICDKPLPENLRIKS